LRPLALALALVLATPVVAQEDGARRAPAVRCVADDDAVVCPKAAFARLLSELDTARVDLVLRTNALAICRTNRTDERESYDRSKTMERDGCDRAVEFAWKALDPPGFLDRWLPTIAFVVGAFLGGAAVALVVDKLRP
jgi:hypothetical protein